MRLFVVTLLTGLASVSGTFAETPIKSTPLPQWQTALRTDLEYLASEELRGRSVDDEAIDIAADFVADRFAAVGLNTMLYDGKPFQTLTIPVGVRAGDAKQNYVRIESTSSDPIEEEFSVGMNPMAIGTSVGSVTGELVFVGYGITAPKLGYDDYRDVNVRGKIVAILRKEPGQQSDSSPFDGKKNSPHAFFETKLTNAIAHGAAAVVFINDRVSIEASMRAAERRLKTEEDRKEAVARQLSELPQGAENVRETLTKRIEGIDSMTEGLIGEVAKAKRGVMQMSEAGNSLDDPAAANPVDADHPKTSSVSKGTLIPVVSLARDTFEALMARTSKRNLQTIEDQIDRFYQPQSFAISETTIDIGVDLQASNATTSNVVAELPGRGALADETLIVGAHYDHVGMGGYASLAPGTIAIHNGADDNASGTSAMIAIASMLVERLKEFPSHRRVVFIGFTGEERGLVGSKYYARHPRFPLSSTVAMINLDMVGRLRDNELTIYGTKSGEGLESVIDEVNQRYQFNLLKIPSGYGPSDHQSFCEVGVPVLFFFTGLHNDYHRPTDDSDKIDYGGLTRITDMVCDVASQLSTTDERPKYAETEKRVQIRRQLTAYLGVTLSDQGDHVSIVSVVRGGAAERAGLKPGDRLNRLEKRSIRTATDVRDLLRERSAGETINIQIFRSGQALDLPVRLDAR